MQYLGFPRGGECGLLYEGNFCPLFFFFFTCRVINKAPVLNHAAVCNCKQKMLEICFRFLSLIFVVREGKCLSLPNLNEFFSKRLQFFFQGLRIMPYILRVLCGFQSAPR